MNDVLHESIGPLFSDAFSDLEKNRYGKTLGLDRVTSTLGAFESPTQERVLRHRWASKRTKRVKSMFMDQTAFLAERSMALAAPLCLKWTCKDKVMCHRELAMLWVTVPCTEQGAHNAEHPSGECAPCAYTWGYLCHGVSALSWHPGQGRFSTSSRLGTVSSAPCSGAFQLFIAPLQIPCIPAATLITNYS